MDGDVGDIDGDVWGRNADMDADGNVSSALDRDEANGERGAGFAVHGATV